MQRGRSMIRPLLVLGACALFELSVPAHAQQVLGVTVPRVGKFADCTVTVDCSPTRSCEIPIVTDTRDCMRCVFPLPFGGCGQMLKDPACEAARTSQNARSQADAAAKHFECEQLKLE